MLAKELRIYKKDSNKFTFGHWYMMGEFPRGLLAIITSLNLKSADELMILDHSSRS